MSAIADLIRWALLAKISKLSIYDPLAMPTMKK